jgi:hypothetical protein
VIGASAVGLAVLALFASWERITDHPMLNLSFFRQRPFSAAIPAVVTLTFGLFGALFVLTQFLQLALGFTALQAGIRALADFRCHRQHRLRPSGGGYGPARHRSRAGAADGDRLRARPLPATAKNSLGGALAAARAGGTAGPLIHLAKTAFISGMDLGLLTGAVVAVAGCLVALICLPARSGRNDQLIGTGRGFPLRSHPSTPGRRHAGSCTARILD